MATQSPTPSTNRFITRLLSVVCSALTGTAGEFHGRFREIVEHDARRRRLHARRARDPAGHAPLPVDTKFDDGQFVPGFGLGLITSDEKERTIGHEDQARTRLFFSDVLDVDHPLLCRYRPDGW